MHKIKKRNHVVEKILFKLIFLIRKHGTVFLAEKWFHTGAAVRKLCTLRKKKNFVRHCNQPH